MRKGTGDSGLDDAVNMDVMMDNMTDVVGTLLMVLVIVQLQVNNTMNNIESSLPKVTQQEMQQAQREAEETREELAKLKQAVEAAEPVPELDEASLAQARADLRRFELTSDQDNATLMETDKLKEELAAKQKLVDAEKQAVALLLDERERLKALLDTTPIPKVQPAKVVRIPQAIEIPPTAVYVDVLCAHGGVYGCDLGALEDLVKKSLAANKSKLLRETANDAKGKGDLVFDHEKTLEFLNGQEIDTQYFVLKFPLYKTRDILRMEAHPKERAGEDPSKRGSKFTKMLGDVKRSGNAVVWFRVMPDSFETYLQAREMCDRMSVPAGWELTNSPVFLKDIVGIQVNRLEEPPPPPPPPVNQPQDVVIPPLKRRID